MADPETSYMLLLKCDVGSMTGDQKNTDLFHGIYMMYQTQWQTKLPRASVSKRVSLQNHSYEYKFDLKKEGFQETTYLRPKSEIPKGFFPSFSRIIVIYRLLMV